MHTIKLHDGTILDNLELNGNNYISDTPIDDAVFIDNLATVEISDGEDTYVYGDMKLVANRAINGQWWFILAEKTQADKDRERLSELEVKIELSADKTTISADGIDVATITATIPVDAEYCFITVNGPPAEKADVVGGQVVREFSAAEAGLYKVEFFAGNKTASMIIEVV